MPVSSTPSIDLTALRKSYAQMAEALQLWQDQPEGSVFKPHLRSAVIQSFEYTYEIALRMLRRVLVERSLAADLVQDLSDELIQVMKESRKICRHLHLPLQSGSSRILKAMNRRYTKEQYLELAEKIRRRAYFVPKMRSPASPSPGTI
jgi:hypothetical protein